jgi:hypothetical protein
MRVPAVFHTVALASVSALLLACESADPERIGPLGPEVVDRALALSADQCLNFQYETLGEIGLHSNWAEPSDPWYGGFGALPVAVVVGHLEGTMFSWVESFYYSGEASGKPLQGAEHLSLHHRFELDEDNWFQTDDRAVCSPSPDGSGCMVNDQMRIVAGAGIFADAEGWIKNKGQITFGPSGTPLGGTLGLDLRGRVCGDGV